MVSLLVAVAVLRLLKQEHIISLSLDVHRKVSCNCLFPYIVICTTVYIHTAYPIITVQCVRMMGISAGDEPIKTTDEAQQAAPPRRQPSCIWLDSVSVAKRLTFAWVWSCFVVVIKFRRGSQPSSSSWPTIRLLQNDNCAINAERYTIR